MKLKFVGFEVVEYTKSDDGDREVYLTKTARDIIQEALDIRKRNGWDCDDYLFVRNNQRINHYGIQAKILKACKAIGIEDKTMHKIRKIYISSLIDGGVNIDEIRKQVGHSDERTTYGNYCFNRFSNEQTEAQMERALSGKEDVIEKLEIASNANQKITLLSEHKLKRNNVNRRVFNTQ